MKRFIISVLALALAAALLSCSEKGTEAPRAPTVVEEPVTAAVRLYVTRDYGQYQGEKEGLTKLYICGDEGITCVYESDDCEIADAGPGAVTVKPNIDPERPADLQKKNYVRAYFYRGGDIVGYALCKCGMTMFSSSLPYDYAAYIIYQHVFTEGELARAGGVDKEYADGCIGRVTAIYEDEGEVFSKEAGLRTLASPPRAEKKSITFSSLSNTDCMLTVSGGEFEGGGTSASVGNKGAENKSAVWYPGSDGGTVYMRVIYRRGDRIVGCALYTIEDLGAEKTFETYFPLVDGTYQDVTEEYVNGRLDGIVSALTGAETEVTGE